MPFKKLFIFFVLLFSIGLNAQEITDLLEPLRLIAGRTDSFYVKDLFYTTNYDVKLKENKNIKVEYKNDHFYLTPAQNFEGSELISFNHNNEIYSFIVFSGKMQKQVFKFKPETKPQSVNLFGTFNSWNRQNIPMYDNDGDGIYEVEINIEPGRYEYKFFVDGKELFDKANPEKVSNGMGDFNSIINIDPLHPHKMYLHLADYKHDGKTFKFSFFYEKEKSKSKLTKLDIIALIDNEEITDNKIIVKNNKVTLLLNKDDLKGKQTLRIAASKDGQNSNLQTVFLNDGIPVKDDKTSWHNSIIYSVMVDRFNDGDKSLNKPVPHPEVLPQANYNGGDIQGIINKIEDGYFNDLGVNTLWVTPVIDNTDSAYREYPAPNRYYTGYHGYWPVHPTKVEDKFGDIYLFTKMVNLAHKHNIKVLLDFVGHHIHIEHPFWIEHRDWFGDLELPDGSLNLRRWDEYRLTTWFEPYMPSFDFTKSNEAVEAMTDNAIWWMKTTGIDGFRHDAVKHVPNLFWRRLTEKIRTEIEIPQNKKVYQIGETFGGFDLIKSYVNNGQLTSQFNFNLYDVTIPVFTEENVSFSALDNQLQKSFLVYGVNNLMGNLMDSHDKNRFMAYADGDLKGDVNPIELGFNNPPKVDDPRSYDKLKTCLSFIMTAPGVPIVYYGDEIGMTGASDPDNRRMMRFDEKLSDYEKSTLVEVKKIINIRKNHSALNYGDFLTLHSDMNTFSYVRSDYNERVLVFLNKGDKPVTKTITLPTFYNIKNGKDLLSDKIIKISQNKIIIDVPAYSYKFIKLN